MPNTVLVTGATGFTGSNLARTLVERGDRVRALVRKSSNRDALAGLDIEYVCGDLANDNIPADTLRGVDTVFHIAAAFRVAGVPDRYFYDVNVKSTDTLLKAALRSDVRRFVHCSTAGVMKKGSNPPGTEETPYGPGDTYQQTKMEGELLALRYFREQGLPGTVIRPAGIYGPGDLRYRKLYRSINRGRFVMIGSGNIHHPLVYIDDLVQGFLLGAERDEALGEIFIIGGENPPLLKELVARIAEVLGKPVPSRRIPIGPVMAAAVVTQKVCRPLGIEPPLFPRRLDFFNKDRGYDNSKARRMLGYESKVDWRTGVQRTAKWYRENNHL